MFIRRVRLCARVVRGLLRVIDETMKDTADSLSTNC